MRFLLDNNLPRSLVEPLLDLGVAARHVVDVDMANATDADIVAHARASGAVIVTHDLDFGHLLAFSGKASPSVIILRVSDLSNDDVVARLRLAWDEIGGPLAEGAIVVVEDHALRIRPLPVARSTGR